jgi:hypothetical protein
MLLSTLYFKSLLAQADIHERRILKQQVDLVLRTYLQQARKQ